MYQFNAVSWGRDIEGTAKTARGIANILARWLVWDAPGGYMRCAPDYVTYKGVKVLSSGELYEYSRGRNLAVLRLLRRRVKAVDNGA